MTGASRAAIDETATLQLAVFDGDEAVIHALPASGRVSLGRAEENDVRIDKPSVSRKHAVLHIGPPLCIEDLGGANGTHLRDPRKSTADGKTQELQQIKATRVEIALGDCVLLGTTLIVVRRASAPSDVAGAQSLGLRAGEVLREPSMIALYKQAARAAQGLISVLLLGETGVGKDVLAHAVHRNSPRARGPFLGLNCGAISESLLESELFGHEKGAFTGATHARAGLFESANGGTVFLDEVGELPLATQVKLLRVLEDRRVRRVGGRSSIDIDVRYVSATNRDLDAACAAGTFRQDLYYRLAGIVFNVPPLRERPSEIAELAGLFAERSARQVDRPTQSISAGAMALLQRYAWPGNVRELRNAMERAAVLAADIILPEHLPSKLTAHVATPAPVAPLRDEERTSDPEASPSSGKAEIERQRILDALVQCAGNQTRAAALLGISRRTLVTRLDEHGLPRPHKKT